MTLWYAQDRNSKALLFLESSNYDNVKKYTDFFYPNVGWDIGEVEVDKVKDVDNIDYTTASPATPSKEGYKTCKHLMAYFY